ncbi:MAG: hypothetical protein IT489_03200 [Gammaproteobacteria bacterium]|nr:hypothetical protein [Gammaproteobacteria bacterium]
MKSPDDSAALGPLFAEPPADPFAPSKIPPSDFERQLAERILQHKGWRNPISVRDLCALFERSEDTIKHTVADLVVIHGIRIGGARVGDKVGYYAIETEEDLDRACKPLEGQIFAMWRRVRKLRDPHYMRDLRGQLRIEGEEPA